jgi:hypothetical protein
MNLAFRFLEQKRFQFIPFIAGSISNFVMEKRMAHLKIIRVKKIRR